MKVSQETADRAAAMATAVYRVEFVAQLTEDGVEFTEMADGEAARAFGVEWASDDEFPEDFFGLTLITMVQDERLQMAGFN